MASDFELLQAYGAEGSESAFAELVQRHAHAVYASALRQTGNPCLAEDVTQIVFTLLARKAAGMKPGVIVSGWLFRATRFAAKDLMKAERRRLMRESSVYEEEAAAHGVAAAATHSKADAAVWDEIAPNLDGCLNTLNESDRQALLLRFFENCSLAEVGRRLGIAEDAARKRVRRALDRLQALLVQKGAAVTENRLETLMTRNASPPAPAHLLGVVAGASMEAKSSASAFHFGAVRLGRHLLWQQWKPWLAAATLTAGVAVGGWQAVHPANIASPPVAARLRDDYRPAGFPDSDQVNAFVRELQQGTMKADKTTLAGLIRYPLRVNAARGAIQIESPSEFAQKFDGLFAGHISKMILKSPAHGLYCDDRGIMIGAGEVWLGPDEPGKPNPVPKIIALNLDP